MKLKNVLAKIVRIATLAPVMAITMLTVLFIAKPGTYTAGHYVGAIGFLALFPLIAYPVSLIVPALRRKGRDGQRNLAIVFSVIGYIAGTAFAFLTPSSPVERIIYLTYLFSGGLTAVLSFGCHIKSSGHACGVAGPVAMLIYCIGWQAAGGIAILCVTYWASLRLGRHTIGQLLTGSCVPVIAMFLSIRLTGMPL